MIDLWFAAAPFTDESFDQPPPCVTPYVVQSDAPHPGIVICPGGGYQTLAKHEGEPVALWLNSLGISAFVLSYRHSPYRHPVPVTDVRRALRFVRHHAEKWCIDPTRVGVLGFSAGGHLAACAAALELEEPEDDKDCIDRESARPDAAILGYPVISLQEYAHGGTVKNLLGSSPDPELKSVLSVHRAVSASTPPCFLWHTADDPVVPLEHSLLLTRALRESEVPVELHVFPHGRHGLGLAEEYPAVAQWTRLCAVWLRHLGFAEDL